MLGFAGRRYNAAMRDSPRPANRQTDPPSDEIARMFSFLENERRRIYDELRSLPAPITACDQQFNYLLERQAAVNEALSRSPRRDGGE